MADVPLRDAAQALLDAVAGHLPMLDREVPHGLHAGEYVRRCAVADAASALRAALAAADTTPALVQCGWIQTWDDPDAPPGPLYALSSDPEGHADDVADETLDPIYRLAAADGTTTPTPDDEATTSGCPYVYGSCVKTAGHDGEHLGVPAGRWHLP